VGQVCSKAIYEIEVAYHDSTEVSTHMAFHQEMRPILLEKLMLIVKRSPLLFFLVHNSIASCYSVEFVTFCTSVLRMTKTGCGKYILCVVLEIADLREEHVFRLTGVKWSKVKH
jgi:hypothetical protein